ncbi:3-methyladenine DNA glycosylase AlkD [Paenibacillus sp. UNCCL117]|uniref:DNA alkylation repair protein n=1 Tax=unclassified Paenibacillus TaxID=185978 RepID=UPI000882D3EF|nr:MULTISPECIES: DNA alkylation repair protein [unclassified Paenibacillus]SDD56928.1 3-methyladenine DNA glycosylase AlkD [Paenibacillus sp. cl123]SFW51287.1 3-methyladenine DNA glycosylase AlkD [Paenibacillus sp. UNCCL117]
MENTSTGTGAIREQLNAWADPAYQQFASSLLPGVSGVLGVRLPVLRKLAKQLAKGDWRAYAGSDDNGCFEEIMLQGMVLGYAKADIEELLGYVAAFVPRIDNWSVCDSFCSGLVVARQHQERVWAFVQPYLSSDREYELRFGVVMLLNYYTDETYIDRVLALLEKVRHEGYYAKMAVAWALSVCFVKQPGRASELLLDNTLDDFTFHKTLQKITESFRVDAETKAWVRSLRRKRTAAEERYGK